MRPHHSLALWLCAFCLTGSVRTSAQSIVTIDVPGSESTSVLDINDHGDMVGTFTRDGSAHGFLFAQGLFTVIDIPAAQLTAAVGINNRGDIVGTYIERGRNHVFRWKDGVIHLIDVPITESVGAVPTDINDRGDIVGTYSLPFPVGSRGFLLDHRGIFSTVFLPIDVINWQIDGINNEGEMVGRFVVFGRQAGFLIDKKRGFSIVDVFNAPTVVARAINERGDIIGWYSPQLVGGVIQSFVRDKHGDVITLNVPGAAFTRVESINARGVVAGVYATDLAGPVHGFVSY